MSTNPEAVIGPVGLAFAEHLRAFHLNLPAEEQTLLELLLALADAGAEAQPAGEVLPYFSAVKFGAPPAVSTNPLAVDGGGGIGFEPGGGIGLKGFTPALIGQIGLPGRG